MINRKCSNYSHIFEPMVVSDGFDITISELTHSNLQISEPVIVSKEREMEMEDVV